MEQDVYIYEPGTPVPKDVQCVKIPDGVTVIEPKAFCDCPELRTVTIPHSVNVIGDSAFQCCPRLQDVILPNSITEIGNSAFESCDSILSVTIPDSVTKIGSGAFADARNLQHITISKNVTGIEGYTFWMCTNLRSVTLPDGIMTIGRQAFGTCLMLRSIILPNSLIEIGMQAFDNSGLQSVTIPDSVAKIDHFAFCGCRCLQFVVMPENADIGSDIFLSCGRLQSVLVNDVNIAPFIDDREEEINSLNVIIALVKNRVPLNGYTIEQGIQAAYNVSLERWIEEYRLFGSMRLPVTGKIAGKTEKEDLCRAFALQNGADRIPRILNELAAAAHACGIPTGRIAANYDIGYTDMLVKEKIPIVPAAACRCYFDRKTCDELIRTDKISAMAEAIALYNRSGHREEYRELMDHIVSHTDTKTEDILYALDHAGKMPAKTGTEPAQTGREQTGGHCAPGTQEDR